MRCWCRLRPFGRAEGIPTATGSRSAGSSDPASLDPQALDNVHNVHNDRIMTTAYVSGRVPARYERLVAKQARAARTSKSDLVARYVIEKSLETEFPGISFRDSLSGREAYLTGRRVAVWEVLAVHAEAKSMEKTARSFRLDARARQASSGLREVVSGGDQQIA